MELGSMLLVVLNWTLTWYHSTDYLLSCLKSCVDFVLFCHFVNLVDVLQVHLFDLTLKLIFLSIELRHIFSHKLLNIDVFVASAFCCFISRHVSWRCTSTFSSYDPSTSRSITCWRVWNLRWCTLYSTGWSCRRITVLPTSSRVFLFDLIHFVFLFFL